MKEKGYTAAVGHLSDMIGDSSGAIPSDLGWDLSLATNWRPFETQNIVLRASGAVLAPGSGFHHLFTNSEHAGQYYSVLLNAIVAF